MSENKSSWVVKVRCTVDKEIVTSADCTQAQAEQDPFSHSVQETETDLIDWEVLSVEQNN